MTPTEPYDVTLKRQAWARQSAALGAERYRIGLIPRDGGEGRPFNLGKDRDGGPERFFSAEDVAGKIMFLRAKNAHKFDIILTPLDDRWHYLVIDDVRSQEALDTLLSRGYKPCLMQESSENNAQVILKVERRPGDKRAADAFVRALNVELGDPRFSGAEHPFRLAGYINKKPGRNNFPIRIFGSQPEPCEFAAEQIQAQQAQLDLQPQAGQRARVNADQAARPAANDGQVDELGADGVPTTPPPNRQLEYIFQSARRQTEALCRDKGWPQDQSRIDLWCAKAVLRAGFSESDAANALMHLAPDVYARHRNVGDYARRTVQAARDAIAADALKPRPKRKGGLS
jgi:hypothetical protein